MNQKRKSIPMPSKARKSEPPATRPQKTGALQSVKYAAINAFLIFHLVAITAWCIPVNSPLNIVFREHLRPYFLWSGLFQSWDMFSPNPKSSNAYLEAVVIYKDGSTELWPFPRMELLSYRERYFKERYRKYEENLNSTLYPALWPDAARFIARQQRTHASPPRKVILVARWSHIIPPDEGANERGPWDADVFYSYDVQPEDLQ